MALGKRRPGAAATQRAELEARLARLNAEARDVNRALSKLAAEPGTIEAPEAIRAGESLRRKRTRILFGVERTEAAIERAKVSKGKRVVQGPQVGHPVGCPRWFPWTGRRT
ncbi:hypothetical protein GCM10010170_078370 [Dactylosporangium salmoneum]|uniref:Uncharacterized protein n=1 Tax=Dactylosporangium salmoneum TaxID=53361 RepID=A0ABP5UCR7_9ACTN